MSKNKSKLDLYNLCYLDLYTVKSKEGYITTHQLDNMVDRGDDYWVGRKGYNSHYKFKPNMDILNNRKIIIEKPKFKLFKKPKQVTEYLTGEQLDYAVVDCVDVESPQKELDAFVLIDYKHFFKSPTTEELYQYLEEHIDKEAYGKELRELKIKSKANHMKSLHQKEYEKYIEKVLPERALLVNDLLDQFNCNIKVRQVCLEVIRNESFMQTSTIEDLLEKIRNKYPYLTEDEYRDVVAVVLRVQSTTCINNDKNKGYLKVM